MGEHSAEKDVPQWTRLTKIQAAVTFECVCGGEHEFDVAGAECDGATSVEWKCDDCGSPLLVYVDVDARVRVTSPAEGDAS